MSRVPATRAGLEKADLSDHVAAGLGVLELVRVPRVDLRAAAASWAAREQQGWVYGVDTPPPLSPEERELVRNSSWLNKHKRSA